MKSILTLLAISAVLFGSAIAADSLDTMNRKITGTTSTAGLENKAIASYALVSKDNTIALSAYGGSLTVEGALFNAHQTSLLFNEPTADRAITFSNATGRVELLKVTAKAATATLTSAECYGGVFTNTGASGAVVLSLPTPAADMHIRVYLTVAQDVDINAADSTRILVLTNGDGDAISSAGAIGNSIELVAISATQWVAFAVSGTWSDVN